MSKKIKASTIAKFLKTKLYGKDIVIERVVPVYDLLPNSISFVKKDLSLDKSIINIINKNPSSLIICPLHLKNKIKSSFITSERPYYDFGQVIKKFFAVPKPKIVIGKNCKIAPTAVIGNEGFSFYENEKGIPERVAQIGGIRIGDNVDIGSSTTIDRGILTDTCIGPNVKIDDLVYIGHNCVIGEGTRIAAGTTLAGGVTIGKNCRLGLNVSIKPTIKVGDNAIIGMGAVVIRDVAPETTVVGNPAKPLKKNK